MQRKQQGMNRPTPRPRNPASPGLRGWGTARSNLLWVFFYISCSEHARVAPVLPRRAHE